MKAQINPRNDCNTYEPKLILTILEKKKNAPGSNDTGPQYYIESHRPIIKDGQVFPGPAHPLKISTFNKIGGYYAKRKAKEEKPLAFKEFIPPNMIYANSTDTTYSMIWYCPPEARTLYFNDALNVPSGKADLPGLIFKVGHHGSLYVYAVKTKKVTVSSRLYHAPFHNIYEDGDMCMGNIKRPIKKDYEYFDDLIEAWENIFFNSYFSHLNHNRSPIKGNVNLMWKDIIKNEKPFPTDLLVKHKKIISQLI